MALKVLFAGTPEPAVPTLKALAADDEHFEVVAVLTRPDAASGRGRKLTASPVKQAALELGIPVLESDPKEPTFVDELAATGAEAGAVVAYGKILRQNVLDALPMGWYNLHFSLLPQWRGAAPVQRAIWSGDTLTGATVFQLTAGMDTGPILAQSTLEIKPSDTSGDILAALAQDGSRMMTAALQAMASGEIIPQPQQPGTYEVAKKITTEDAHIRFDVPAFAVDRQIRACTPEPGAWCLLHTQGASGTGEKETGVTLHVLSASIADTSDDQVPQGLVPGRIQTSKKHVWVGTASGPLELRRVKMQGKKAMDAADWARGARLADDATVD